MDKMSDSDMSMSVGDRISELPEAILHHILSYLPISDAACTSVLSKGWNNAWETLPYLNFREESFTNCRNGQLRKNRDFVMQKIVRSRQHISIEKFSLLVPSWQDEQPSLSEEEKKSRCLEIGLSSFSVISYVATPFLWELELIYNIMGNLDLLLPLSPSILSAKWLTALSSFGFDLSSSWSSLDIKFTCLQKLAVTYVALDDSIMENLILGSRSSLETLELEVCMGLRTLHLSGEFVKLKQLMINLCAEVVLKVYDAPLLEDLVVLDSPKCYFNLKNCPRLRKVRFLCYSDIIENKFPQMLASSNQVEELNIINCSLLNDVHISSDSLRTLSLLSLNNLRNLRIFSPDLVSFTLDLPSTPSLVPNFSFDISEGLNLTMFDFNLRWVKFLSYFRHIKTLTLKAYRIQIIPDYARNKLELLSPLYGTTDISVITRKNTVPELVEYLLWLAPRAEKVSILSSPTTTLLSLKLVYHNEGEDEKMKNLCCPCCKLLPGDCWRHCLDKVKIKKFEGSECDLARMKDFFLKEVKNLKIMNKLNVSYNNKL